ncbi:hypothetical protein CAPTEDRAFT_186149 [Capitella teleta]|uniref:Uncharacterized protein n=1 Tax=Capitella teleta TaxID=283909 RepID=R7UB56_CAPTE|nr:hypothetical protein CAPTEDRAFT_186149 [Capitella teleta]|eukprot:ELU03595.1 hypothetical protein CAPTEDRAFT_186149 [Capitella teleta]
MPAYLVCRAGGLCNEGWARRPSCSQSLGKITALGRDQAKSLARCAAGFQSSGSQWAFCHYTAARSCLCSCANDWTLILRGMHRQGSAPFCVPGGVHMGLLPIILLQLSLEAGGDEGVCGGAMGVGKGQGHPGTMLGSSSTGIHPSCFELSVSPLSPNVAALSSSASGGPADCRAPTCRLQSLSGPRPRRAAAAPRPDPLGLCVALQLPHS